MQVFNSFQQMASNAPKACAATIGNFDGVHRGHQKLISSVVEKAHASGIVSVVITFDPHPEHFLQPETAPMLLMPLETKLSAMERLGVDIVFIIPFDAKLAHQAPEEFVQQILVDMLHVQHLAIGYDYAFGKNRSGNAEALRSLGEKYAFTLEQFSPVYIDEEIVSSTLIRKNILSGNVAKVAKFLGRPHAVEGTIVHGMNRGGKLLGFPTANIAYQKNIVMPKAGVYAVKAQYAGNAKELTKVPSSLHACLNGVASIGLNPTFGDVDFGLEVFLLDFDKDIYDQYMNVFFIDRIRDEVKFSSVDSLVKQINNDVVDARHILCC